MKKEVHKNEHDKQVHHLTINGEQYEWHQQYISGAEIRKLGNITEEDEVFLAVKKPWEDEPIIDDSRVNLARPEIEHFLSKGKNVSIVLIVNGREKTWKERRITFEQVVILAFGNYDSNPNICYTVTYGSGPRQNHEGSMVKGDKVFVHNKMIFNVTATDKS
jgi:hypothetical protein